MFAYLGHLSLTIEDLPHGMYFPTGVKERLELTEGGACQCYFDLAS